MKIIKEGTKPPDTVLFECDVCHCVFEEVKSKCNATSQIAILHDNLGNYNCKCPCCGKTVYSNQ